MYLSRCIDSLLVQKIYEIILIDDGSTDRSGDICDEYAKKDTRVKVFHQTNQGVSAARNLALEKATGEWVAFVDADDWVESNWYEIVEANIIEYNDAEVFTFGFNRLKHDGCETNIPNKGCCNVLDYISASYSPFGWTYVFKLSKIREFNILFPSGVKLSEDQCFIFKYLSTCSNVYKIDKVLYNYYRNDNSAVAKLIGKDKTAYSLISANDFLEFTMKLPNIEKAFKSRAVSFLYEEFFNFYTYTKRKQGLQKIYREKYKETISLYSIFEQNKHFKLAQFNLKFAVWFHYKIKLIKSIIK